MNVIIVDDNRLFNRFLATYISSKGDIVPETFTDPTKVIPWIDINARNCDTIVMDIGMPRIDGITLTKQILEKYPDMIIMMFTGLGYDEEVMRLSREAGAKGYVNKGLGPAELYSALKRAHATSMVGT